MKRIDVEESTKEIIEVLGRVHFNNLTYEADLRELLVGVAPAALKSCAGQRSSNDHALLRLLDEIFGQEEELRKSCVESYERKTAKAEEKLEGRQAKVEEAIASSEAKAEETKEKLASLTDEFTAVREAEEKLGFAISDVLSIEKVRFAEVRRDHFEVLKKGNVAPGAEKYHLSVLQPWFSKLKIDEKLREPSRRLCK